MEPTTVTLEAIMDLIVERFRDHWKRLLIAIETKRYEQLTVMPWHFTARCERSRYRLAQEWNSDIHVRRVANWSEETVRQHLEPYLRPAAEYYLAEDYSDNMQKLYREIDSLVKYPYVLLFEKQQYVTGWPVDPSNPYFNDFYELACAGTGSGDTFHVVKSTGELFSVHDYNMMLRFIKVDAFKNDMDGGPDYAVEDGNLIRQNCYTWGEYDPIAPLVRIQQIWEVYRTKGQKFPRWWNALHPVA